MGEYSRSYKEDFVRPSPGLLWEDYETTQSAFSSSAALNFFNYGVTANLATETKIAFENGFADNIPFVDIEEDDLSPLVSPEEANVRAEKYGMNFNEPIRQSVLDIRIKKKRDELERQSIVNRSGGVLTPLLGGLAGAIADPANIAASFIPIVREARYAKMISSAGIGKARLAKGALEGAVGAGLLEAPTVYLTERAQADYDMYDSMMNIAFGGILGGGLHFTGGYIKDRVAGKVSENAIPDRIESTSIETKEIALRSSLADAIEGRVINVEPILKADENFSGNVPVLSRNDLDFRLRDLTPENIQRLSRNFENPLVYRDAVFKSRSEADQYIRNIAKEENIKKTDFIIERTEDGVEVHRATEGKLEADPETGRPKEYKSFEEAKSAAKKLQKQTGRTQNVLKLKPKKGRAAEKFVVADVDDVTAKKMNKDPTAILEKKTPTKPDLPEINLRDFAQEKNTSSALVSEESNLPQLSPIKKFETVTQADEALQEALDDLSNLDSFIDTQDAELLSALNISRKSIDAEMKQLDDEIAEAERFSDAIKAFAACMIRG